VSHVTLTAHPVNTHATNESTTRFYVRKTYHVVSALLGPTASFNVGGQWPTITVGIVERDERTADYPQKMTVQPMALCSPELFRKRLRCRRVLEAN
jgi:hypothetical protein